jgi:hypothetical protein
MDKMVQVVKSLQDVGKRSELERKLPYQLLQYFCFHWQDDAQEAGVEGLDLHRRMRFETWLLGGVFFTKDEALEAELNFLHELACTIRMMISNPEDKE